MTDARRQELAAAANRASSGSRYARSAPILHADSSREALTRWLQWNDPNGSHLDELALGEDIDPYDLEGAWDALEEMLADVVDLEPRHSPNRASRKKTHLTVITGRHGEYAASSRQKTTRFPTAGESIQAHIVLLRAPAQAVLERQLARGFSLVEQDGHLRVALEAPITAAHYVEALVAAYSTINLPREQMVASIKTQAFGKDARGSVERYIDALLDGKDPETAARALGPSPKKLISLKVLSETTKMSCHSFNLPAGPVFQDGTCPASQLGFMYQTDAELADAQRGKSIDTRVVVPDFICNGCYAIKHSYGNPSIVFAMSLRLLLTKEWLRRGVFSDTLTQAIELARETSRRRLRKLPADLAWTIPNPDYFRIHDAGDFFSPAYARAWFEVCERLPDVRFWSPTRMWALKKQASSVFAQGVPKNLALRPSALHFGEAAPRVEHPGTARARMPDLRTPLHAPGLSAGSGSGKEPEGDDWACPAYERVERGGGAVADERGRVSGGTCARAHGPNSPFRGGSAREELPTSEGGHGCRACWGHKNLPIFYHEH